MSMTKQADMLNCDTRLINIQSVKELPVWVRNASKKIIDAVCKEAKSDPGRIGPITVGKIGPAYYTINDFETILGLRKAGIKKVEAIVTEYSTMNELLVAHVHENFQPREIDPVRLRGVVHYMIKKGEDLDDVCKKLWIDRHPDLNSVVRATIIDEARDVLLEMATEMSEKLRSVVTPAYYVTMLAAIMDDRQVEAANQIKAFMSSKAINYAKFSWPSYDSMVNMLREYPRRGKKAPVEERITAKDSDVGDLKSKKKTKTEKPDKKTIKEASKYIESDPDLFFVPIEGEHPDLIVNKKTGRAAVAKETNGTYSITGDLSKPTHVLPDHVVEHLGVTGKDSLFIYKYTTIEKAQIALSKAKKMEWRCVIITTKKIPKR